MMLWEEKRQKGVRQSVKEVKKYCMLLRVIQVI